MANGDAVALATSFVAAEFADASIAVAAGSRIEGRATATSDLDIVVVTTDSAAPFRATYRHGGLPIEVFVHTVDTLQSWSRREADAERRSPLLRMCARGVIVWDPDGRGPRLQDEMRRLYEAGPAPLTDTELGWRRYVLTDLRDDLEAPATAGEAAITAANLAQQIATLGCELEGWWSGTGKWTLRHLHEADEELATQLESALIAAGRGEHAPLLDVADALLGRAGGRLQEGFWQSGKGIVS